MVLSTSEGSCSAETLIWGNKDQLDSLREKFFPLSPDLITIADCVYYDEVKYT